MGGHLVYELRYEIASQGQGQGHCGIAPSGVHWIIVKKYFIPSSQRFTQYALTADSTLRPLSYYFRTAEAPKQSFIWGS